MSRRVLIGFLFLNVIVTLAVAWAVISFDRSRRPAEVREGPTQIVILTATPLPGAEYQPAELISTIDTLHLTGTAIAQVPPDVVVISPTPDPANPLALIVPDETIVATLDPAVLPPIPTDLPPGTPTVTPQDDGCLRHVIVSGDTIFAIAQKYGVFPGDVLLANNLGENDLLRVDDVLIIPVEGCAALITPSPSPLPTNTPFQLTRIAPTVTLAPTAVNAQVEITNVRFSGDVNSEEVEIRNLGNVVNLQGWQLVNENGDAFLFPEFRMQRGSLVRLFSRQGQNTPAALYWGRETPAWAEGDTVTLLDSSGNVQSTFRIGETQPLFQGE
jgi:LysM repeat protein